MREPTKRAKEWLSDDGLAQIEKWAEAGLAESQIAHNMGVAYSTFRNWRDTYTAIATVLKKAKEVADYEVENSLFKKATGFYYEEEKTIVEEVGGRTKTKTEIYKKFVIPDTASMIFWLKNRQPEYWKDKIVTSPEEQELSQVDKLLESLSELDE